jgi:hypothetical protein
MATIDRSILHYAPMKKLSDIYLEQRIYTCLDVDTVGGRWFYAKIATMESFSYSSSSKAKRITVKREDMDTMWTIIVNSNLFSYLKIPQKPDDWDT